MKARSEKRITFYCPRCWQVLPLPLWLTLRQVRAVLEQHGCGAGLRAWCYWRGPYALPMDFAGGE